MRKMVKWGSAVLVVVIAYLLLWPVPIDPVAWDAPKNRGYAGEFAANDKLESLTRISMNGLSGPEDGAVAPDGLLYMASHEGAIVQYDPAGQTVSQFAHTNGRPLGLEFGPDGVLYVADAYRGLLAISPNGDVTLLSDKTETGSPINYADDVDIAADGTVYFTDASVKFGAKDNGGTLPASMLDLMEHGPNGRVLKYDPTTKQTTVFADGLSFANGIALTKSGSHLLVVETGTYSISKYAVSGEPSRQIIIDNLPGFPDNINRNADGTFWVGLVSPRSAAADAMSNSPLLRKIVMRLPAFMRPKPQRYGFVVKIDENGAVLETKQGPSGAYAMTTGLIEGPDGVAYITSLTEPDIGMLAP